MAVLDHWHPVLASKRLRGEPVGVRLAGNHIALFRGEDGRVGALEDVCPHRRMRLSAGKVVAEMRFHPDRSYREENVLPPVRAPHEGESCLARLEAIAALA